MNKRAKGNRIEREFMQVLKNSGKFVEIWKPCHCRGNSDIFGLFDIMALENENYDTSVLHLFQVKGNKSGYSSAKKEVKAFACKHGIETYVVLRVKNRLWKVTHFPLGGPEPFSEYEFYVNDKFEEVERE